MCFQRFKGFQLSHHQKIIFYLPHWHQSPKPFAFHFLRRRILHFSSEWPKMVFLSECLGSITTSVATDWAKKGIAEVFNHLLYFFCWPRFSEQLTESTNELAPTLEQMRRERKQGAMNLMLTDERDDYLMRKAEKNMEKSHSLLDEIKEDRRCLGQYCPNCIWQYMKSREAATLAETLKNIKQEWNQLQKKGHQAEIPNAGFNVPRGFILSKAAQSALVNIMGALGTSEVTMIGLHGMPGVGKTTLANQVKAEAERKNLFQEFVKVTVTEKPITETIQHRVAEQLKLTFHQNDSIQQRASKLMLRLQDEKKKLLVLDDVWSELNLNEIGIPAVDDLKECKILLTTRKISVCRIMNCQRIFPMDALTENETLALLKKSANLEDGSSFEDSAKKVAKKCGRLPVAIVSVGKALRGKSANGWARALGKLQEGEHEQIRDISKEENAYRSIKFSFDELPREETKRCLLLCSLHPEDYEIYAENLARYVHGLGLYPETRSVQVTLSEVLDALDELKDFHLLLEAETEGHVKMHDLVRDILLVIGKKHLVARDSESKEKFIVGSSIELEAWPMENTFKDCLALSLLDYEEEKLSDRMDFPNLKMLLVTPESIIRKQLSSVPHECFQGVGKLQVLSLTRGVLSLQSLENLTHLRSLELRNCYLRSADLSSLGCLKLLEILSLHGSNVGELPDEIGELKLLKVLDLTDCYLKYIPPNVISKLSKLEELYIIRYNEWKAEGEGASVVELNSLQHLAILSITIGGYMPNDFVLHSPKLTAFQLHVCDGEYPVFYWRLRYPTVKYICMDLTEANICACRELFNKVYHVCIRSSEESFKNMFPDAFQTGFEDLSHLQVFNSGMECLVNTSQQQEVQKKALSNLVKLKIYNTKLREICEGPPPDGFLEKLQSLWVYNCEQIITLLPSKLLQAMQKLETVEIDDCQELRDVFVLDGVDEAIRECLSHLKTMNLSYLCSLKCIWKGPSGHVNLKSLAHLTVHYCKNLPYIMSVSLAKNLGHLEGLHVLECDRVECIITDHDESEEISEDMDVMEEIVFPKLLTLWLEKLPRLEVFSRRCHFKFPCLQQLVVKKCPRMRTSFYALLDASVHAKNEAWHPSETEQTRLLVGPTSATNASKWNFLNGEWV